MRSVLPGHTKASSLHYFPLGKREHWSKFRYNFIFYVDEMHLKGGGSARSRGRALAESAFPAHTDEAVWQWSLSADRNLICVH